MRNLEVLLKYISYKGGVNNLQVAEVVVYSQGIGHIIKRFKSTKMKAEQRAKKYINQCS